MVSWVRTFCSVSVAETCEARAERRREEVRGMAVVHVELCKKVEEHTRTNSTRAWHLAKAM